MAHLSVNPVHDLRNHGDPKASAIIGKYNANDVVSSVRWSPSGSHLGWTTDGGDFQFSVDTLGGIFTHEYLDDVNIFFGFERGHMALIDTRMFVKNRGVGEIRRSKSDKFAIFGHGGLHR
ncbi:hypothetical protein PHMEG_00035521 [Phytophthora megakarya]|uniref:Uncharacterized protein n=1 Tax=Phytophthora megakarya TaxID=4795 RepID=A0A225URC3_9STRA|nr:hypothetical protein PHMEG_00035521 [Phytophthora megakarya]